MKPDSDNIASVEPPVAVAVPVPPVVAPRPPRDPDAHFRTDHLLADLKGRTVRGGAVTLGAQAVKFVLQLVSTAVLARLLTPNDFGLIAMVAAFTGFVSLFNDLGLSMATVQRQHITHDQVSTLFWINVALSLLFMLLAAVVAPAFAWFYGEPRLTLITLATAATFIFGGLTAQHTALLRRQMRFTPLALIEIASLAAGITTAITLASLGFGYWSLVAMTAAAAAATMLLTWLSSGWKPGLPKRRSGVRPMLAFGGSLTAFNFLNYFTRNADNVIVGTMLGAPTLGIYSRAYNLLMLPISQINDPIGGVAMPALSRLQNDPAGFRRYYVRAIQTLAFATMPLVLFCFVATDAIILTILGPQWTDAVSVFRWLALGAFVGTINFAPGWLCVSLGRANRQLYWAILSAPLAVLAFFVGAHWGVDGVAAAFSVSWTLLFILFVVYACYGSPVRLRDLVRCLWRIVAASVLAGIGLGILAEALWPELSPGARLIGDGLLFATMYLGCWMVIPGGRAALADILRFARQMRPIIA